MKEKMYEDIEQKPVYVVLDRDGYLIQVGDPDHANKKEMGGYVMNGDSILNMTLAEYKAKNYKWIYDKPKSKQTKPSDK